jgi:hypothetical protein
MCAGYYTHNTRLVGKQTNKKETICIHNKPKLSWESWKKNIYIYMNKKKTKVE